jgi:pilus assembly protein CpaB
MAVFVNRKTALVLVFALVLAIGAAWSANRYLRLRAGPDEDASKVRLVVASRPITLGEKIQTKSLDFAEWPRKFAPKGHFVKLEDVQGQVARQAIFAGEPIVQGRIAKHDKGSTLSAIIPVNKRAVTIRVNDVVGVAGFILPGNRVDILSTRNVGGRATTITLLESMKVLAVDQSIGDKDKPTLVRAVTLEATPEEGEILVQARNEGSLQLALRNTADVAIAEKPKPQPVKEKEKVKVVEAPQAAPQPKPRRLVEVIRGTKVTQSDR